MTDATEAVARALSLCRYGTEESWQPFTDEAHDAIIALDRHRIERAGEVAKALCNDNSDQPYTERQDAAALIATLCAELETERYNRADMQRAREDGVRAGIEASAKAVHHSLYAVPRIRALDADAIAKEYEIAGPTH